MTETNTTPTDGRPLGQDILALLRHWFRGRRGMIALAVVVLGTAAYFNWSWLVAAGIAPVLVALAPCAAMCALGLCMKGGAGSSCGTEKNPAGDNAAVPRPAATDQVSQPTQRQEKQDA
jgi:hypothetical protein